MSATTPTTDYSARLVPALQRIQREFGYLKREGLEDAAKELDVPLHRLQAVASFFPHFRLVPPKKVTVSVCRDMACHLAGSSEILKQLKARVGDNVEIKGVSCAGRCDRAPSACVGVAGSEHESYYLGRDAAGIEEIIKAYLAGEHPKPDLDADQDFGVVDFAVNPYGRNEPNYAGALAVISIRDKALDAAAKKLGSEHHWAPAKAEQFRRAALGRIPASACADPEVAEAVKYWSMAENWMAGVAPEKGQTSFEQSTRLANWSDTVFAQFDDASLRGMGGAGQASSGKLRDVRNTIRTAHKHNKDSRGFVVVNGDESEPSTFKDRELLLRTPHLIVEGVVIAGLLTDATQGFIFIRHEYTEQIEACRAEIKRAESLGLCGRDATGLGRPFPVEVFPSPGGYICGEQSALIEAMSDRRGEPRNLPPKLETNGLENLPTIVSNVETYAWMPYICIKGGKTYAQLGVNTWKGRRLFSICGDVKRPGVYEVPMGMTLRELIYGENYCRGIVGDRPIKAFAPSGPSGGFLPMKLHARAGAPLKKQWVEVATRRNLDPNSTELDLLDLELELDLFRALSPTAMLGAGLAVYAENRNMVDQAVNAIEFYRNESCGKCVPCRLGSQKLASVGSHLLNHQISATGWKDEITPMLTDLHLTMDKTSICGLGRSVPNAFGTVTRYFKEDFTPYFEPIAARSRA